ncbi:MAG: hypothetical protein QM817_08325 [Archangium sp.]
MKALQGVAAVVLFCLVTGYGCFGPPGISACGSATGYGPAMLEVVEHCPQASERLGAPLHFGMLGVGCGNYESGGDTGGDGHAWGNVPVAGAKETGSLDFDVSKSGSVWTSDKLVLTFADGAKLDVHACASSFEAKKGDEALNNILVKACDDGVAASCEGLAATLEAKGDAAGAQAAHQKACKLGLASACQK